MENKEDLLNRLIDIVIRLRELKAWCDDLDRVYGIEVLDVSLRPGSADSKNKGCVSIDLHRGIDEAAAALEGKFNNAYLDDLIFAHKEFKFSQCTFIQSPVTLTTKRYLGAGEKL